MQVIFDPDIPEDLKKDILKAIEEENIELCRECGANVIYVAMIDNTLDVKCYECGGSFFEIELSEE
jgi:DNA-directed RNA polymerase subunit RPC12/RpoP